jgi:hypothetical protein
MSAGSTLTEVDLLKDLPDGLRSELLGTYSEILRNFREHRWEPAELDGGKLCEIVYTILRGYVDGSYPAAASKPRNMIAACAAFESAPMTFPRSVRIQIPRMLVALYEIRSNRSVAHVGGDVNPNHMDAVCVVEMSKWLMCELVRIFHAVSTEDATAAVDSLVERTLPLVWKVGENLRVLKPDMSMRDKTLVLLYQRSGSVDERELLRWVEHSNGTVFRQDIILVAHKGRLIEYDRARKTLQISPLGIRYVEEVILQ